MAKVLREKEFNVSAERLADVIIDFEGYTKILGEVKSAKPVWSADKKKCKVNFELEVVKRFNYDLDFNVDYPNRIEWTLAKSDFFKENRGAWILTPKGKDRVLVNYEVEVAFGFLVPGWITKKLTEVNLPKMFERFEAAARERS